MTILKLVNRFPPILCRLCARKNRGYALLSNREIAARSGIPRTTVSTLSKKKNWNGVPIDVVDAFALACGVDLLRARRQREYIRRSKMASVKYGRGLQRQYVTALLFSLREPIQSKQSSSPPLSLTACPPDSPARTLTP